MTGRRKLIELLGEATLVILGLQGFVLKRRPSMEAECTARIDSVLCDETASTMVRDQSKGVNGPMAFLCDKCLTTWARALTGRPA